MRVRPPLQPAVVGGGAAGPAEPSEEVRLTLAQLFGFLVSQVSRDDMFFQCMLPTSGSVPRMQHSSHTGMLELSHVGKNNGDCERCISSRPYLDTAAGRWARRCVHMRGRCWRCWRRRWGTRTMK